MMYTAIVNGEPKGDIWKVNGCWRWGRGQDRIGVESYPKKATLDDVRRHIKFVTRAESVSLRVKI